jgi:two-component system, NarL family, sensor histidine kinase DesK
MSNPEVMRSGPAGSAVGRASMLAVAGLGLLLFARVSDIMTLGEPGYGEPRELTFTVILFVLPVMFAVPGGRGLLERWRWQVLAVQAAATWVPFFVFGGRWQVGIGGLLAGFVLLTVPGRISWLLAGGLLAAEVAIRAFVTGLPPGEPAWTGLLTVVTFYIDDALVLFGLVRLAQIVGEVEEARGLAAGLAAAGERLRAAEALQSAVGDRLGGISARAAAARGMLDRDAAGARAQIAGAGAVARDAVAQARAVTASRLRLPGQAAQPRPAGQVIGARLAWAVMVIFLVSFSAANIGAVVWYRYGPVLTVLAVGDIVLTGSLQLYHSGGARLGRRPGAWPVTLALQALLVFAFVLPFLRVYIGLMAGFVAGSVLLFAPGRWRWAGCAALIAGWTALYTVLALRGMSVYPAGRTVMNAVLYAVESSVVAALVYGLSRMAGLARELDRMRGGLAQAAAAGERLRVARDVHDLLGLGLSAIALKADLAQRLIGRDDSRAAAEIDTISQTCATVRADLRRAAAGDLGLSLSAEFAAAREILASAGIDVHIDADGTVIDADSTVIPEAPGQVLAPVLREAVTNVLRHATATTCRIEVAALDGWLRLHVVNDGVPPAGVPGAAHLAVAGGGHGLPNLSARLAAAGGRLSCFQAGGAFELTATIPQPAATAQAGKLSSPARALRSHRGGGRAANGAA